ncbi:pyrimidine reductase family protein [Humibacter sp.]|jgi:riboflavin biosynthesis pyrimidine reductase|uniref:pyrimidine reductase family protein n=1 Tax=Humibacter sp. TaxID=1940291 RepID=UPI003F7F9023
MSDDGAAIDSLWPAQASDLDDDAVIAGYEEGVSDQWVRVNFVSSIDGSATQAGRSGGLSDAADKRVFALLRRVCDVVLVGAGTVRVEGYGGMRVDDASEAWRASHGFAPQPTLAIVSGDLGLDPASDVFTKAPVRPVVLTVAAAPEARREALAKVADVIVCGEASVDTAVAVRMLGVRGLRRVHCEGGPHLFGTFAAERTLNELCLTVSPVLEGGLGKRIIDGAPQLPLDMRLAQVLRSGDTLLLRYLA